VFIGKFSLNLLNNFLLSSLFLQTFLNSLAKMKERSAGLTSLPSEVLVSIFQHLDYESLEAVEAVCAHFRPGFCILIRGLKGLLLYIF